MLNEKYLGDMISSAGLSESVHATVLKRKGQVISSIIEIKAVVKDCRTNIVGGVLTGLDIWELAILPYLLNNAISYQCHRLTSSGFPHLSMLCSSPVSGASS